MSGILKGKTPEICKRQGFIGGKTPDVFYVWGLPYKTPDLVFTFFKQ